MSNHNRFQFISDSAGCAVVREHGTIVTVRDSLLGLCFGIPPFGFLQNVADRIGESRETAMGRMPVSEVAHLTD